VPVTVIGRSPETVPVVVVPVRKGAEGEARHSAPGLVGQEAADVSLAVRAAKAAAASAKAAAAIVE
jgi:hypothetical protein